MAHHFQKRRAATIKKVKRMIAKCMPKGAADTELKSVLARDGIAPRTVREYLDALLWSGDVEFDAVKRRWFLPVETEK